MKNDIVWKMWKSKPINQSEISKYENTITMKNNSYNGSLAKNKHLKNEEITNQ